MNYQFTKLDTKLHSLLDLIPHVTYFYYFWQFLLSRVIELFTLFKISFYYFNSVVKDSEVTYTNALYFCQHILYAGKLTQKLSSLMIQSMVFRLNIET